MFSYSGGIPGLFMKRSRVAAGAARCMTFLALIASCGGAAFSSSAAPNDAARVFIDVPEPYHDFIKQEIPFVCYVRDRSDAQVHVLYTSQTTGGGGTEHSLHFIGEREFAGINDTLLFFTNPDATESAIRNLLVQKLKMGLIRYVEKTAEADDIMIMRRSKDAEEPPKDKWDYWVFGISSDGYASGQKLQRMFWVNSYLTADRVTPSLKLAMSLGSSYNESRFSVASSDVISLSRSYNFSASAVKGIDDHWSYGIFGDVWSSTFDNTNSAWCIAPAVEYDIFPYHESTRRELRIQYSMRYTDIEYDEETIYDTNEDRLFRESLSAAYVAKERWGSISTTLKGSHYMHDIDKNRLTLYSSLSLRLFEGFSITVNGTVAMIHDLLMLAKKDATNEEILLQRRQLETQYQYYFSFGMKYSFGNIYSNVVNPRFGN